MDESSLIQIVERYATAQGLSTSRVCALAVQDGKFLRRLSAGRSCTLRLANALLRWLSDHWPETLDWPDNVPRPVSPTPRVDQKGWVTSAFIVRGGPATVSTEWARDERSRLLDATVAGEFALAEQIERDALATLTCLGADGKLAHVPALCAFLGVSRREFDYCVFRYRTGRSISMPRSESIKRIVHILRTAGDVRFAAQMGDA